MENIIISNYNYICVCMSGEDVECLNKMDYLGHTITNDRSNSLVDAVSKDFNIKFNSFIFDFGKIHSDVRGMERFYIDWRKAIRQVWKLS